MTDKPDKPLCECHGEPMRRRNDLKFGWRCTVKAREAEIRYRTTEKNRERDRRYDRSEKGRARRHRENNTENARIRKQFYELTRVRLT